MYVEGALGAAVVGSMMMMMVVGWLSTDQINLSVSVDAPLATAKYKQSA